MQAVELAGFGGFESLRVVDVDRPRPTDTQVLIEVKAAGINFAELELTKGKYPSHQEPPFIMGFEAAGVVTAIGSRVKSIKAGDRVATLVASGGYAEYATAEADVCIPIPAGVSFAEATTIPVQGLSAYALLKYAATPQPGESVLIQAAAGGVGLYLVQLARLMGFGKVIALAGSSEKVGLLKDLGVDTAIDYSLAGWPDRVRAALGGKGANVVLEAASGDVGRESFKLLAPFGRIVVFGSRNIHDSLSPSQMRELIYGNQSIVAFNLPTFKREQVAACVPELLQLISNGRVKLFAPNQFRLAEVVQAFEALSSRRTIGKVVLIPERTQ
jgi:NADPH2:quinone reductase